MDKEEFAILKDSIKATKKYLDTLQNQKKKQPRYELLIQKALRDAFICEIAMIEEPDKIKRMELLMRYLEYSTSIAMNIGRELEKELFHK